jgi:multidrug efflux system membrane fusion protein
MEKTVPVQIRAIGNVEAYSIIQVKSQVAGELTRVYFKEGQDVKKGDLLFEIDPRPFQEAIRQIEANIARDVAQEKLAEANVTRDLAQLKNAQTEANRYAALIEQGIVTRQQYDQYRTNAEALSATVNADRAAVASTQETIKADQAALANAKLQLEYTAIRSPLDGRTGNLMVHQGNLVKANDIPLVVINQITPTYVSFAVPEHELAEIRKYNAAGVLRVQAIPPGQEQHPIEGAISFVDNTVDPTTGTIRLKGLFANSEKLLWPGQFVNVLFTLTNQPNVVVIPTQAIQTGQAGQYVFVIKDDLTVESRPITAGRAIDDETVIEKGLQPGEKVVTDGQLRLVPGATVEIKNQPGTSEAAGQ